MTATLDTYYAVSESGNGLFISYLESGAIQHFYDRSTGEVTVPEFDGLRFDPSTIKKANESYSAWLRMCGGSRPSEPPLPRVQESHEVSDRGVSARYTVDTDQGAARLLRASYTAATGLATLRPHSGGRIQYEAAVGWANAIRRFIQSCARF